MKPSRHFPCSVEILENRIAPASFVTMTLTNGNLLLEPGDTGETVTISQTSPGIIHFEGGGVTQFFPPGPNSSNTPSFDLSGVTGNVTIELGSVGLNNITFSAVKLPKNLLIEGTGGVYTVNLDSANVGGALTLNLGGAHNTIDGKGSALRVGGDLSMNLSAGTSAVNLTESFVDVGGSFNYSGNGGADSVAIAPEIFIVGKNINLTPGDGQATIALSPTSSMTVGGSVKVQSGNSSGALNQITIGSPTSFVSIGHGAAYIGGPSPDEFYFNIGNAAIKGGIQMSGAQGDKTLFLSAIDGFISGNISDKGGSGKTALTVSGGVAVKGSILETGGAGSLNFFLNDYTKISGSISVKGGVTDAAATANVTVYGGVQGLPIGGSLTVGITGHAGLASNYDIANLLIKGALTLNSGAGDDNLYLDNLRITGATKINTGAGGDTLALESASSTGASVFHGAFTALLGDGNDSAAIGTSAAADHASFLSAFLLDGGAGTNSRNIGAGDTFTKPAKYLNF